MSRSTPAVSPVIPSSLRWSERVCCRILFRLLETLSDGCLEIQGPGIQGSFGNSASPLRVTLQVEDPAFYRQVLLAGSIGAAESYIQGQWHCDDLVGLVRLFVRNQEALSRLDFSHWRLASWLYETRHRFRRNSRLGSRRNIAEHYDLGNDFYALFLDETMTYSCGIFESPQSSLREASLAKYDRICRQLRLGPSDHVLEIGSGWGGFACYASREYGCRVTTTTISKKQYEWALKAVQERGLSDRVQLLREDYRDLSGTYEKLVSIEMIEAVGHQYLDTFFSCCSRLLRPGGLMALQAITIADRHYQRSKTSIDFIQSHVFPGSAIPSITSISDSLARVTDLTLFDLKDISAHYPRTLRCWRERFLAQLGAVREQGYSEEFVRLWEFYLCYCEGGFLENHIGDVQMILAKPDFDKRPVMYAPRGSA